MNKTGSTILIVLGILLVIGMGFGGYYLGRYLDQSAVNKAYLADLSKPVTQIKYSNTTMGVELEYPSSWKFQEFQLADDEGRKNMKSFGISSPDGSQFTFFKGDISSVISDGTDRRCDVNDPDGKVKGNSKCTFFDDGNIKYARFLDSQYDSKDDGTFWGIALAGDSNNPSVRMYLYDKRFFYYVKKDADLTELDKIMKSVKFLESN